MRDDQDDIDWANAVTGRSQDPKQRPAKLQAKAPVRHKKTKPFGVLELHTAAKAFAAMHCAKAMTWVWLQHQARTTGKRTVAVPNGALAKWGVSRETKRRALKELEAGGLIVIERRSRKTPLVTLL
jgi:hypothetical protein